MAMMAMELGARAHVVQSPESQEPVAEKVHAADVDMPDWCRDWMPNVAPGLGSRYVQHCLLPDAADSQQPDPRPDDLIAREEQRKRWADGGPAVKVVADMIEAESETDLLGAEDLRDVDRYNEYMERKLEELRDLFATSDHEQNEVVSAEEDVLDEALNVHFIDQTTEVASTMESMPGA